MLISAVWKQLGGNNDWSSYVKKDGINMFAVKVDQSMFFENSS